MSVVAKIKLLEAITTNALNEWESWIHDQLDGTSGLTGAIEKVTEERQKLKRAMNALLKRTDA